MKRSLILRALLESSDNLRYRFGNCSELGVQEFDRVIVERRCHVILNEGNLSAFHL